MAALPQDPSAERLLLQSWLSPAFPIGSFAYSQGLESAFAAGELADASALHDWLEALLTDGPVRNDAILLGCAWRAAEAADVPSLREINALSIALAGSAERRLEITAQGRAFARTICASWADTAAASRLLEELSSGPLAYPIAVAIAASGHGVSLLPTLEAFLLSMLASAISAAMRLGALGQTHAQRILARFVRRIPEVAGDAAGCGRDDVGSATLRADIFSFLHEVQYSRLFRT